MENEEKIKIMTKLAVYDKKYGKKDKKITEYYKSDYVYRKNLSLRLGLYIGLALLAGVRFLYVLSAESLFIDEATFTGEFKSFAVIAVLLLVFYTVAGSFLYSKEYDKAATRLRYYNQILDHLDSINNGEDI